MASSELLGALKRLEAALDRLDSAAASRRAEAAFGGELGDGPDIEVTALQARIVELEQENQQLREAHDLAGRRLEETIQRVETLLEA